MQPHSISRAAQAFAMAATLTFTSFVAAEPSRQEVDQALKAGDIAKAETMMKEVVGAHPESAKAHFRYSEILAAEGQLAKAKTELSTAEKIQPGLGFARPEAVNALKQKLYKTDHTGATASSSNPLLLWGGIALVGFLIVMAFRTFRRPQQQPAYANNPQAPNGYGPQGAYPAQGGGMGSGIMGGLATGAAVGAGIVAGEMLMHKILDDDHPNASDSSVHNQPAPDNYNDISGNDFADNDNGSWDNDSSFDSGSSFDNDSSGDWS